MKRFLCVLLFMIILVFSNVSFSQCTVVQKPDSTFITTCINSYAGKYVSSHVKQYQGSPYLGGLPWHSGSIVFPNGHLQNIKIAFNVYSNMLSGLLNDTTELNLYNVNVFYFENKKFIKELKKTRYQEIYFEVLFSGEIELLKRYRQELKLTKQDNSFLGNNAFDLDGTFVEKSEYYIRCSSGEIKQIVLNYRSLVKEIPDLKDYLNAFSGKKILAEEDLVSIFLDYDKKNLP